MSRFITYFNAMTHEQKQYMADRLDCSISYLSRIAHGRDKISAKKAQQVAKVGDIMRKHVAGQPEFDVGDLVEVCAKCVYFKSCRKGASK